MNNELQGGVVVAPLGARVHSARGKPSLQPVGGAAGGGQRGAQGEGTDGGAQISRAVVHISAGDPATAWWKTRAASARACEPLRSRISSRGHQRTPNCPENGTVPFLVLYRNRDCTKIGTVPKSGLYNSWYCTIKRTARDTWYLSDTMQSATRMDGGWRTAGVWNTPHGKAAGGIPGGLDSAAYSCRQLPPL